MRHTDVTVTPNRRALRLSLLLHVCVLGLILLLPYLHRPPEVPVPRMVEAVLVRASAPATLAATPQPTPPRAVEPPKPEPVVPEKHVTPPPETVPKIPLPSAKPLPRPPVKPVEKPVEKPVPKPEPAKPAPPRPIIRKPTLDASALDAEMQAMQQEVRQAEMDRFRHETEKNAAAAQASANQAQVSNYMSQIQRRTETKWNRPLSARRGMVTTLRVTVLPGGEVANVMTVHGSGDAAFDASAEEAVRRASPLPVPADSALFNANFRSFKFDFKCLQDAP